jgi:hypothetical protein
MALVESVPEGGLLQADELSARHAKNPSANEEVEPLTSMALLPKTIRSVQYQGGRFSVHLRPCPRLFSFADGLTILLMQLMPGVSFSATLRLAGYESYKVSADL